MFLTRTYIKGHTTQKLGKTTDKYSYFLLKISPNPRLKPLRKPEERHSFAETSEFIIN